MTLPSRRAGNFVGFLICAGLMAFALYAEYGLFLMPCPLCVLQRIAVIAIGLVYLAAALHNPSGGARLVYSGLIAVSAVFGVVVAGRHVWMQHLPADQVPACGPGLGYMIETLPFSEVRDKVFSGSGESAEVSWSLLGLSMPEWVLVAVICLGAGGIWNNLRK